MGFHGLFQHPTIRIKHPARLEDLKAVVMKFCVMGYNVV
jgi:hypothetical protein